MKNQDQNNERVDKEKYPLCITYKDFQEYMEKKEPLFRESLKEITELYNRVSDSEKGGVEGGLNMMGLPQGFIQLIKGYTTLLSLYYGIIEKKEDFETQIKFPSPINWEMQKGDYRVKYLEQNQIPLFV